MSVTIGKEIDRERKDTGYDEKTLQSDELAQN